MLSGQEIYERLESMVLPMLEEYQTDLTTHDRNQIAAYPGPLLLSYRPTGTNLMLLGKVGRAFGIAANINAHIERKLAEVRNEQNVLFLYFTGRDFVPVTRAKAEAIAETFRGQLLEDLRQWEAAN